MSSDYTYMVCTRCMTFNHHAYIEDALNGFCMQQTKFPFVCVIVDDASTDGEPEVIKKYFDTHFDLSEKGETDDCVITFGRHKTNGNCYFVVFYLKYNHYSINKSKIPYYLSWQTKCKYIAFCEGDDYWTNKYKLQRQVDCMEKNDKINMVYTDYQTVDETKHIIERPQYEKYKKYSKSGDILPVLFKTNFPLTLTTMYREDVFRTSVYTQAPIYMDYMTVFSAAFLGDVVYLNEIMGAYRHSPYGMMNSNREQVNKSIMIIKKYVSYQYLRGHSKKENILNDIIIKHRIMILALLLLIGGQNDFLFNIIKIKKIMVIYVLLSFILICINKLLKLRCKNE